MRYQGNCETFVRTAKSIQPDDPIYLKVQELVNAETELIKIRKDRYNFVTLNEKLEIKIIDKIGFDENIARESSLIKDLNLLLKLFNELNPLFEKIESNFPQLSEPTITGIHRLQTRYKQEAVVLNQRIKNELSHRVQSRLRYPTATVDEVLADPVWIAYREPIEKRTKELAANLVKLNKYIYQIDKIFESIFNRE